MERIIKNIRKWMIIICCCCLCVGCNPQEEADETNMGTESMTDADENALAETDGNAGQNAQEENHLAEISDNTTDTISNTLTETDSNNEPNVEENYLAQISDKVDEKAEPYIVAYVSLSDDTEIEYCNWMEYGEEQVLRVAIQYKEQPENDYRHKEDYFLFISQDGDVLNVIEVNYEDKGLGMADGMETDCATHHRLGWGCDFDAHFEDVTFDGEEDLLIFVGDGRCDRHYCAYIYENGEFRYERTFEHIPVGVVDTEKEVIYGSATYSAMSFGDVTYKYINGEFLIIEAIDTNYVFTNGENVLDEVRQTTYEYEYINGKNVLDKTIETIDKYEYEFINGENVLDEIVETTYEYEYINGKKVLVE